MIGLVQVGLQAMADRYTYLPSIGIAMRLAWGIPSFVSTRKHAQKDFIPGRNSLSGIMAVLTWQQCGYWKNNIELFNHALRVTKDNSLAHNNRGSASV